MVIPVQRLQLVVGGRIRAARRLLGLSQLETARRADVDFRYFGAIERGSKNVTLATLSKIAAVLGVQPFELLVPPNHVAAADVPDAIRFALLLEKADDVQRDAVLRVLETFTQYGARRRARRGGKKRSVRPER